MILINRTFQKGRISNEKILPRLWQQLEHSANGTSVSYVKTRGDCGNQGAYLTIEPKAGAEVPVAVWSVEPADEKRLDVYEGFPTFYYKAELELPVRYFSGKTVLRKAFVYIMHEERPLGLPSSSYVRTCLEGYSNFGFDESILLEALNNSRSVAHEIR